MLEDQLAAGGGAPAAAASSLLLTGTPGNETEAELQRLQNQNEALKEQVESLNHV